MDASWMDTIFVLVAGVATGASISAILLIDERRFTNINTTLISIYALVRMFGGAGLFTTIAGVIVTLYLIFFLYRLAMLGAKRPASN